jgi:hypothetical protein
MFQGNETHKITYLQSRHRDMQRANKALRRRSFRWIQKQLQIPLIVALSLTSCLAFSIFSTVALVFVHHNYDLFKTLALKNAPTMVENLYRELVFIEIIAFLCGLALFIVAGLIAWRFSSRLLGPLVALKNHMQEVLAGRWHRDQFHYRSNDDLIDTLSCWSALYEKQRKEQIDEIALLEGILANPQSIESLGRLEHLIKIKKFRIEKSLFKTSNGKVLELGKSHDSRVAS